MNGYTNNTASSCANPLAAGCGQMDINMLYQKLNELGELLKENREKTRGLVATAEGFAARPPQASSSHLSENGDTDLTQTLRIAELTKENMELRNAKTILIHEQRENSKLLGEYEHAIGEILEKIRDLSFEKESKKAKVYQESNQMLQDEKDAHLRTRLERDEWHSRFLQGLKMLREAHRLRVSEEEEPTRVITGLQNEVRAYRLALGLESEG